MALAMILLRTPSLTTRELEVDGSKIVAGLIPAPIPWPELEGPCATAWWWPGATEVCRSSTAHALVFLEEAALDAIECSLRVTKATSQLLQSTPDALGVYWGAGTVVQPRDIFIEQAGAASREQLPLHLWVDFRVQAHDDGSHLFVTTGLEALFNIAHYLCDKGLVLKDGDTIGLSATEKKRVRHRPSLWGRAEPVLWLEID
jgi:hypothetical protein